MLACACILYTTQKLPGRDTKQPRGAHNTPITDHTEARNSEACSEVVFIFSHSPQAERRPFFKSHLRRNEDDEHVVVLVGYRHGRARCDSAASRCSASLSTASSRVVLMCDLQLGWCFHCIIVAQPLSASGAAAYARPAPT